MESERLKAIQKIQKWYRTIPGCRKCGCKRLAWKYICVYCYHDRHSDTCEACINGFPHRYF